MRSISLMLFLFTSFSSAQVPVVLISIDGFAHHYLEQFKPKNILALAKNGVQANGMMPVYPSKTFPNHLSIVTGVYPAKHGIIHNKFYHRKLKENYKLGAGTYDNTWLTAEPIWTKAEKKGLKTAIYFWPESQAEVDGILPSKVLPYKHNTPNQTRLNKVFEWLSLEDKERPNFIATYFSVVDETGHRYGRESVEIRKAIKDLDDLIGNFRARLKKANVAVNLVLVSDHGMTEATKEHTIIWKQLSRNLESINVVNGQTQLYVYEENQEILKELNDALSNSFSQRKYEVYTTSEYPHHWHFNDNNDVVPDMIINAVPPYTFVDETSHVGAATHGYDPKSTKDLLALFVANGPNFKQGYNVDTFENIHIYSLLEYLLGLPESKDIDASRDQLMEIISK